MLKKLLETFKRLIGETTPPIEYGDVKCVNCKFYLGNNYFYAPESGHYCGFERKTIHDPVFGEFDKIKAVRCTKRNKHNTCPHFETHPNNDQGGVKNE